MATFYTNVSYTLDGLYNDIINFVTGSLGSLNGEEWEMVSSKPFPYGTFFKVKINDYDYYYLGIMLNHYTATSYKNWLFQKENIAKYIVHDPDVMNLPKSTVYSFNNGIIRTYHNESRNTGEHRSGDYSNVLDDSYKIVWGQDYSQNIIDIADKSSGFNPYGYYISFGVFKKFDASLPWNEQAGGINFDRDKIPFIKLLLKDSSSYGYTTFTPPPLPGIGYPLIHFSEDENHDDDYPKSKAWIIKDKLSLCIVVRNGETWQTINLGMMPSVVNGNNPFPAFMAGSTGLVPAGNTLMYVNTSVPNVGLAVNLNTKNTSFTNSVPAFPCRGNNSINAPTQVALMNPEGIWRFYGNYIQVTTSHGHVYGGGGSHPFAFPYERFTQESPNDLQLFPTNLDLSEFTMNGAYVSDADNTPNVIDIIGKGDSTSSHHFIPLYPIGQSQVNGSESDKPNFSCNAGAIPRYYYATGELKRYGRYKTAEGDFLVIPNRWQNRLSNYSYTLDTQNDYIAPERWTPSMLEAQYESALNESNKYRMAIKID